jgi:hypothetical protein
VRLIEELQGENRLLLNGIADNGDNVAITALVKIIGDGSVSIPRKLRASATVLSYKVENAGVVEFVRGFLMLLCSNPEVSVDHQLEASELLQRHGNPRILQPIERPARVDNTEPEETKAELAERMRLRREYCDAYTNRLEREINYVPPPKRPRAVD